MDDIAARANITKRALYQHFVSKDDLIKSALAHTSEFSLSRLHQFKRPQDIHEFIDSYFGQLSDWAAKPKWSGGGFTRVVVELADLRGHPARSIARQHKAAVEQWLIEVITAAGIRSAHQRAREIMLLTEGAMVLMLIHGDRSYAKTAALAAKALLKPKRSRRSGS
jgi:AcrR family transcriptional regulator